MKRVIFEILGVTRPDDAGLRMKRRHLALLLVTSLILGGDDEGECPFPDLW